MVMLHLTQDYPGIVKVEDVLFAVKTHAGNHEERCEYYFGIKTIKVGNM